MDDEEDFFKELDENGRLVVSGDKQRVKSKATAKETFDGMLRAPCDEPMSGYHVPQPEDEMGPVNDNRRYPKQVPDSAMAMAPALPLHLLLPNRRQQKQQRGQFEAAMGKPMQNTQQYPMAMPPNMPPNMPDSRQKKGLKNAAMKKPPRFNQASGMAGPPARPHMSMYQDPTNSAQSMIPAEWAVEEDLEGFGDSDYDPTADYGGPPSDDSGGGYADDGTPPQITWQPESEFDNTAQRTWQPSNEFHGMEPDAGHGDDVFEEEQMNQSPTIGEQMRGNGDRQYQFEQNNPQGQAFMMRPQQFQQPVQNNNGSTQPQGQAQAFVPYMWQPMMGVPQGMMAAPNGQGFALLVPQQAQQGHDGSWQVKNSFLEYSPETAQMYPMRRINSADGRLYNYNNVQQSGQHGQRVSKNQHKESAPHNTQDAPWMGQ
jgi:hypothetical protein